MNFYRAQNFTKTIHAQKHLHTSSSQRVSDKKQLPALSAGSLLRCLINARGRTHTDHLDDLTHSTKANREAFGRDAQRWRRKNLPII
jgi:hypothetical protein